MYMLTLKDLLSIYCLIYWCVLLYRSRYVERVRVYVDQCEERDTAELYLLSWGCLAGFLRFIAVATAHMV
jgi:hypothetical protein